MEQKNFFSNILNILPFEPYIFIQFFFKKIYFHVFSNFSHCWPFLIVHSILSFMFYLNCRWRISYAVLESIYRLSLILDTWLWKSQQIAFILTIIVFPEFYLTLKKLTSSLLFLGSNEISEKSSMFNMPSLPYSSVRLWSLNNKITIIYHFSLRHGPYHFWSKR